jgi:exodeoxyribonuclease V beta subunit
VHEIVGLAVKYGNLSKGVLDDFERMVDAMSGSARIAGFMNGSIDAVFRISGDQPRYIVCDYKTNKLHKEDDPNPIESYGRASMEEAMLRDGYFFQAMIYSVALQRYLRQRQPGYDFETHFGGVSYLFLRGLDGSVDANGNQRGNYFWKPPKALIDELDTLFTEKKQ